MTPQIMISALGNFSVTALEEEESASCQWMAINLVVAINADLLTALIPRACWRVL